MQENFDTTDLGMLSYFLGSEVLQDKHGVFVSQKKYAYDLLKKLFNFLNCKPVTTPMYSNEKQQAVDDSGEAEVQKIQKFG